MIGLFNHLFAFANSSTNGRDQLLVITNLNVRLGSYQMRCGGENTVNRPFSIRPGPAASNNKTSEIVKSHNHDRHGLELDLARLQSS